MIIKDMLPYLLKNGYLEDQDGELVVTKKLQKAYKTKPKKQRSLTGKELFRKFVDDAEIPTFIRLNTGGRYRVYSYTLKTSYRQFRIRTTC